jgi:hypothetical protein
MKTRVAFGVCLAAILLNIPIAGGQVLDKRQMLDRQTFWQNRDFDWFQANIPFFDSPDEAINTTYYYRWELVTRHICYGSPNSGYSFTEFANRPFWSGAYGAISCPAGHQIYEVRWLHDPRYVRDYLRYWFRTPGAQPRNYSFWAADSAWATHLVQPNREFLVDLLPDLVENYQAWRQRHWVPEKAMFWQLGHDDGMEFDINAQQTRDILRGGQSLRPSFNAYMWADAHALANIAELAGDVETAAKYREEADRVKVQVQTHLWDPEREFFFPMSNQRHEKDGHVVEKYTLTYETGRFAGSPHGRELHGYVPWAFGMPDAGFEQAWKFLMDPDYFYAAFGPTTVQRHDPLFVLQPGCCWWSGQSWPFATTQTLKAMANVLQNYRQQHISREDYLHMLHKFAVTHRKDGKPYIAEAVHPDTGSWAGHDMPNRSEHYFHSGFTDLVITGLVGVQPSDGDRLAIDPLAPDTWDYFALDHLPYRGHRLAIVWDKTGQRYGLGAGLHVLVNGNKAATRPTLAKLHVDLPPAVEVPMPPEVRFNYAVNNDGDWFPRLSASHVGHGSSLAYVNDGQFRYDLRPVNRWTSLGSTSDSDWLAVDFGLPRPIDTVKLYLLDDGEGVTAPASFELEVHDGRDWKPAAAQQRRPAEPVGRRPNTVTFPVMEVAKLRVVFHHAEGGRSGLTALEAWGPGERPYIPAPPPAGNVAFNATGEGYPQATASHSDRFGGRPERAIDGKIIYSATPMNRWTSYESPNEQDWLEVDFGQAKTVSRAVLHIYDDRGGVQPPKDYLVQAWIGQAWRDVDVASRDPAKPTGSMANTVTFAPVSTTKLRVLFLHDGRARSGVTELEIWEK